MSGKIITKNNSHCTKCQPYNLCDEGHTHDVVVNCYYVNCNEKNCETKHIITDQCYCHPCYCSPICSMITCTKECWYDNNKKEFAKTC